MTARCGLEDCDCGHTIEKLLTAMEEITQRKGAYSRDPLTHAENTIDSMERIARAAIEEVKP